MKTKEQTQQKYPTKGSLIRHFLYGSKHFFVWAVLFALLMSFLDLVNPKVISYTVDSVISDKPSSLPAVVNQWLDSFGGALYFREHLWMVAIIVVAVALLGAMFRFCFRVCNGKGAEKFVKKIRDELFHHILKLPFAWYGENHTGDIIQRCTSDVETIKVFISEQLVMLVRLVILIVMAVRFMFGIHTRLALISLAFFPVITGYSFFFHHRIGSAFQSADEEEARLSAIAQENLTGVRVVRAFGRETYERERFENQNSKYTSMWFRLMKLLAAFWSTSDLVSALQVMVVMIMGAVFCVNGSLTAGNYIAFISYNRMLTWPVRGLGRIISELSKAGVSIDRLRVIMNTPEEEDKPDAVETDMKGDIVFDHVSFQYENGSAGVLEDVSFTIPEGSTFGILGATGSGKSTLMYLLDRLYEIPEGCGKITVGGIDISDMKAESVRKNVGMVLQEPYLFSRSLSENIRIADQKAGMKEIRTAARIASLEETIDHFKEGYDTFVGERGVTLSGGQKQRTAIAQMLIRKPPVMVFDDSLSAVDAETDAKIRAALKENTSGSTVILIAHRITTLMQADQIIVMDRGKIIERGNHEQLLAQDGVYKRIYDLQSNQ